MKLKIDVQQSTIDGLESESKHLALELKETRELLKIHQEKCESLICQLSEVKGELQTNERLMIGITQNEADKEEKISQLKSELFTSRAKAEDLHLKLGTLQVHHDKQTEHLTNLQEVYDDIVSKLHKMNKARHDLETKLTDEIERNRSLQDIVRLKEDQIIKR